MPQYIQVGNDVVEFPDDMSDTQVAQAISGKPQVTPPSSGFFMGLKDPITGGAQLLPRALAGVTSLGGVAPNPVSQFFSQEAQRMDEMALAEEQAYQLQRKAQGGTGFDFARLSGNVINPASIAPAATAAQLARVRGLAPLAQAAIAGAVGGAFQPTTGEGTFGEQKTEQVVQGAIAGPIGEKIIGGAGRVLNPLVSKAEKTMRDLGVIPTTGQTLGGTAKSMEEFAQNLPLIGGFISDARQRVLFNFNKANINKALGKVNEKLPDDVIGRDAIAFASDQISKQYDDVLSKMSFDLDFTTTSNILSSLGKRTNLSPNQRQDVAQTLNDIVLGKFSGQKIDGPTFKGIESDLRKKASNYANSSLASEREIGDALSDVLGVLKRELYFQNPKQTPKLRRVDSAYGDLSVLNIAAANSGASNGVFTPKQLSTAVRQADQTRRKTAFAKGRARGQEESDAAVSVLGDTAGSTLEGRLTGYAVGGYGALSNPAVAAPLTLGASVMYSPGGQALMDAILRSRPEMVRQAGGLLTQGAPTMGGVIGPSAIGQYNRSERTR
jgi:hypothetical protein